MAYMFCSAKELRYTLLFRVVARFLVLSVGYSGSLLSPPVVESCCASVDHDKRLGNDSHHSHVTCRRIRALSPIPSQAVFFHSQRRHMFFNLVHQRVVSRKDALHHLDEAVDLVHQIENRELKGQSHWSLTLTQPCQEIPRSTTAKP